MFLRMQDLNFAQISSNLLKSKSLLPKFATFCPKKFLRVCGCIPSSYETGHANIFDESSWKSVNIATQNVLFLIELCRLLALFSYHFIRQETFFFFILYTLLYCMLQIRKQMVNILHLFFSLTKSGYLNTMSLYYLSLF